MIACVVVAGFLAQRIFGGGTVRSASGRRSSSGGKAGGGQPRGRRHQGPEARASRRTGVSFAAVGDTMLGNSPELPADPGSYLDP